MEEIITYPTFIKQLTECLKITIYINKGTDDDAALEKCIELYNTYVTMGNNRNYSEMEFTSVRKCIKRLNLVLKINPDGSPVDIRNKGNQQRMIYFKPHSSIPDNDLDSIINHANKYKIYLLTGVSLLFILRPSKFQALLWQHIRCLFYMSQILISKVESRDVNEQIIALKNKLLEDSGDKLENILSTIAEIEQENEVNRMLALDKYLSIKLQKSGGINETNVTEASNEVKEIFRQKGIAQNESILEMVDTISSELKNFKQDGNLLQNMFGIAQNVAQKMRPKLDGDPQKFQSTISAITEIFSEAMNNSERNGEEIPPDIKNMFSKISSISSIASVPGKEPTDQELNQTLESLAQLNGMDKNQFMQSIKMENGEIDVTKLEKCLENFKYPGSK